jgi:hypothetical protein
MLSGFGLGWTKSGKGWTMSVFVGQCPGGALGLDSLSELEFAQIGIFLLHPSHLS